LPPAPQPTDDNGSGKSGGSSTGTIIGIIIALLILVGGAFAFRVWRQKKL
jgi:hypothetical protein